MHRNSKKFNRFSCIEFFTKENPPNTDILINYKESLKEPKIYTQPLRKLTVPGLADDFYSNLVDWSDNYILYAVENRIYLFNYYSSKNTLLYSLNGLMVTSVKFNDKGNTVAIGTSTGILNILDISTQKIQNYQQHKSRIGVIEWDENRIITGSRDRTIKNMDIRIEDSPDVLTFHQQEVCGLKISKNKKFIASGGNDNKLFVYDTRNFNNYFHKYTEHKAAVKAIAWSPIKPSLLLSGGGTADKSIKMWDTMNINNSPVKTVDYNSQICNLYWTRNNTVISTHGYSQNDARISQAPTLRVKKIFYGHKNRVIHFSVSKDEKYFVTGSSDNILTFWKAEENFEHESFSYLR
ncbi:WD40 domain-containing protein [Hamiltosporidium magnivora]|uniref:WD40 domain-containing protein n=1 Tax=Hamiltosporidium magnivora TaxID=148818 RepID=A0A4Q9LNS3_9MICR|nr:WD40 domain-containing protein [Hamiltosporidium magnivora]TBU10014.1 WD40 domain-containing protein [Hamiltosporidium magnivora]